jgi:hypothetical protein
VSRLLNEPVMIATAIRSILLALTAFGLGWTAEQIAAVMIAVEAVLGLITRAFVTPNQLAEERVARGFSPTQKMTAVLLAATLGATACTGARANNVETAAVVSSELVLAIDAAEQDAFQSGLYSVERHREISQVILKALYAERALVRAAIANEDPTNARLALIRALDDVSVVAKGVPAVVTAVEVVKIALGSKEATP